MIFWASQRAFKAATYICNIKEEADTEQDN
jgi:hypothetical protein